MHSIMATCRLNRVGYDYIESMKTENKPWIYAAWHNNTAIGVWEMRRQDFAMMASASDDGELIARGITAFGNRAVRGSSSSQGGKAVRDIVRALRAGRSAAITPDGPRGPKYQLQPGVLWIAGLSACPLVPYHIEASRQWVLKKSWDRHKIPQPFTTVHVCIGQPFFVDKDRLRSEEQSLIRQFQQQMMENVARCKQLALAGRSP